MSRGWWYGVVAAALAEGCGVLALAIGPDAPLLDGPLGGALALSFLFGWLALPLVVALDLRAVSGSLPWRPSTLRWVLATVVPVVGLGAAAAYLLRRRAAAWGTVPAARWRYGVAAGVVVWTIAFAIEVAVDVVTLPILYEYVFDPLLFVGLGAVPAAVYLDVAHVRGHTDWAANPIVWPLGAAIPYVGALVCAGYLVRRRRAVAATADPTTVALPDVDGDPGPESSPWFRAAIGLFVGHLALMFGLGLLAGPDVSDATLELAALVLWIPFGPFFAACVYGDARWRRTRGRDVGDHWYVYVASAVIQAAAFWYLLRRATRRSRTGTSGQATGTEND